MTIADIDITRVKQSLDFIVKQNVRRWLQIPIASTIDIIQLSKIKFSVWHVMVSTRFTQCDVKLSSVIIYESLQTMMYLKFIMIRIVTLTYNTINSNVLKKLLINIGKTKKIKKLHNF